MHVSLERRASDVQLGKAEVGAVAKRAIKVVERARRQVIYDVGAMSLCEQRVDEGRSDEAGTAGYERVNWSLPSWFREVLPK